MNGSIDVHRSYVITDALICVTVVDVLVGLQSIQ